jgi:hypothetical protein
MAIDVPAPPPAIYQEAPVEQGTALPFGMRFREPIADFVQPAPTSDLVVAAKSKVQSESKAGRPRANSRGTGTTKTISLPADTDPADTDD